MFDVIDVTSEKIYEDSKSGRDLQIKEDMLENFKNMLEECGFEYNEINIELLKIFISNFNDSSLSKGEIYAYGGWTSLVLFSDYSYAIECFEKTKEYDEVIYYWFMG